MSNTKRIWRYKIGQEVRINAIASCVKQFNEYPGIIHNLPEGDSIYYAVKITLPGNNAIYRYFIEAELNG